MKVSVLTAALPSRRAMLDEAIASVLAQDFDGEVEHLWSLDVDREGAGPLLNRMLTLADGEWVMVLDDDDLLNPEHLATLAPRAHEADVLYSLPNVVGGTFRLYDRPFDPALLAHGYNCVSHTALMRTDLVREVGGWSNVRHFDLDLFCRLEQLGAEFLQIPRRTWTYRLHGSNWSQGTLTEAAL